jgi:hypothetical protein
MKRRGGEVLLKPLEEIKLHRSICQPKARFFYSLWAGLLPAHASSMGVLGLVFTCFCQSGALCRLLKIAGTNVAQYTSSQTELDICIVCFGQ